MDQAIELSLVLKVLLLTTYLRSLLEDGSRGDELVYELLCMLGFFGGWFV
jgi:hypothetical protein